MNNSNVLIIKILPEYRLHENFLQTGPTAALAVMRQWEGVVLSRGFGWLRYPSKYGVTSAWPPSATSLLFVNTASNNAMLMGQSWSDPEWGIIRQSLDDVNKSHAYQKCVCVRKLTPPLQCGSIPLNPLCAMSRIGVVQLQLLTRKAHLLMQWRQMAIKWPVSMSWTKRTGMEVLVRSKQKHSQYMLQWRKKPGMLPGRMHWCKSFNNGLDKYS